MGRGGQWGPPGLSQPPLPLPGLTHAVPLAAQTMGLLPPLHFSPPPPTDWAVALAPTSRVLCLEHLVPLLECIPGPDCLLPHAPVLAAQAVRAKMDWTQGSLLPLHPQAQDPGFWLSQQPRGVRQPSKRFEKLNHNTERFAEMLACLCSWVQMDPFLPSPLSLFFIVSLTS